MKESLYHISDDSSESSNKSISLLYTQLQELTEGDIVNDPSILSPLQIVGENLSHSLSLLPLETVFFGSDFAFESWTLGRIHNSEKEKTLLPDWSDYASDQIQRFLEIISAQLIEDKKLFREKELSRTRAFSAQLASLLGGEINVYIPWLQAIKIAAVSCAELLTNSTTVPSFDELSRQTNDVIQQRVLIPDYSLERSSVLAHVYRVPLPHLDIP